MQTVRLCAAVGACVLAMTITPVAREGGTRQVPGEYPTIQAAVDAADPGDVIRVAAGVYTENVTITASGLRLRASSGVVIDGTGLAGTAVRIAGTSTVPLVGVELSGFEIRNFQHGVVAEQVVELWLHRNEIHHQSEMGMDLRTVRFSRVTENAVHGNGAAGITMRLEAPATPSGPTASMRTAGAPAAAARDPQTAPVRASWSPAPSPNTTRWWRTRWSATTAGASGSPGRLIRR